MPKITIYCGPKGQRRKIYNTDNAEFICNVPNGKLFRKPKKWIFFIYYPRGKTKQEQIKELDYYEAKEMIYTYGTREQYCHYFTVINADGSKKKEFKTRFCVDNMHRVKLYRAAAHLGLNPTQTIHYLIDLYDKNNFTKRAYNGKKSVPSSDPSESDINRFSQ